MTSLKTVATFTNTTASDVNTSKHCFEYRLNCQKAQKLGYIFTHYCEGYEGKTIANYGKTQFGMNTKIMIEIA